MHLPLRRGDMIVFDPCLAHGLSRPGDGGRALQAAFEGDFRHQAFLSGELHLDDSRWAAVGCPWGAATDHWLPDALDLADCDLDSVTGEVRPPARVARRLRVATG